MKIASSSETGQPTNDGKKSSDITYASRVLVPVTIFQAAETSADVPLITAHNTIIRYYTIRRRDRETSRLTGIESRMTTRLHDLAGNRAISHRLRLDDRSHALQLTDQSRNNQTVLTRSVVHHWFKERR